MTKGETARPVRLMLSRRAGFDLQALSLATNGLPAVNVARPGRYGNTFKIGEDHSYYGGPGFEHATAEQCVDLFRETVEILPDFKTALDGLRGKNLACWCKRGAPCHADVWLDLANRPTPGDPR